MSIQSDKVVTLGDAQVLYDDMADRVVGLKSAITQEKAPVILDTATGEIVTIPDGADGMAVETLTVAIEPSQDLHGQANPYPPGGGKNLLNVTATSGGIYTVATNGVVTVNGTSDGTGLILGYVTPSESTTYKLNGCPSGGGENTYRLDARLTSTGLPISGSQDTGSGSEFNASEQFYIFIRIPGGTAVSNKVFYPMVRLSTVSDSTFAPYSNLCPISGWTGANVARTGVNLLPTYTEAPTVSGLTISVNDGKITISGTISSTVTIRAPFSVFKWDGATDCWLSGCPAGGDYQTGYSLRVDGSSTQEFSGADTGTGIKLMQAGATNITGIPLHYCIVLRAGTYNNLTFAPMLNFGLSAQEYTPYAGETYHYPFPTPPGTVYGGTLTVNADGTGTLTLDRIGKVFRGTDVYTTVSNTAIVSFGMSDKLRSSYTAGGELQAKMINSHFKLDTGHGGWGVIEENSFIIAGDYFWGTPFTGTTAEYQTYLEAQYSAGTPVSCVAVLQTPITYNLTNLDVVTLLKGNNNLWADCGNTTIQYPCDTKLFIERLSAPTEDDMIANANITSGKFFMVGNDLYLSTQAIAQGAAIVPGTNCTKVSIADALNSINA